MTPGFLTETFKSRRIWENVFQALGSNYPDSGWVFNLNPTKPKIKNKPLTGIPRHLTTDVVKLMMATSHNIIQQLLSHLFMRSAHQSQRLCCRFKPTCKAFWNYL